MLFSDRRVRFEQNNAEKNLLRLYYIRLLSTENERPFRQAKE